MRSDRDRLEDIAEAIRRIRRYSKRGKSAFARDELVQTWILHHLQIIGEAASKVSDTVRESNPDVPWPQITAMRNILVHEYFGIDIEEIWATVTRDLPMLAKEITHILKGLKGR